MQIRISHKNLFIDTLWLVQSPDVPLRRWIDAGEEKDVCKGARRSKVPGHEPNWAHEQGHHQGPRLLQHGGHCLRGDQQLSLPSQMVKHPCPWRHCPFLLLVVAQLRLVRSLFLVFFTSGFVFTFDFVLTCVGICATTAVVWWNAKMYHNVSASKVLWQMILEVTPSAVKSSNSKSSRCRIQVIPWWDTQPRWFLGEIPNPGGHLFKTSTHPCKGGGCEIQ